jgi:hypothetical protein
VRRGIMAHTSPVCAARGADYRLCDPASLQYRVTLVEGGLASIRHRAPQYRPGTVTHHHGEDDHVAFLESPFRQALEAIHRRIHDLGIDH